MKNIVRYSIYQLYKGKRITLITMAMVIISFCVLEYTVFDYFAVRAGKYYAEEIIPYGDDEVYRIDVSKYGFCSSGESLENINKFYREVKNLEDLEYCGLYSNDEGETIYVYGDVMTLFGIDLEEYQSSEIIEDDRANVWIGSGLLNDYSIGDEYIFDMWTRCKVVGVIPSNKKMLSGEFYQYGEIVDLDNKIIVQMESVPDADMYLPTGLNNFYFCINEQMDIDEVLDEIYSIGEKCNIDISGITSLKTIYKNVEKQLVSEAGERYLLPVVMLVSAVIGMMIATMISIKINKKDAGIMVANGMPIKELAGIYIFENIIKIVFALVVAYFYCIDKVKDEYKGYYVIYKLASKTFIAITLIVIVVSNLSVVLYFKNKLPHELIGGAND